MCATAPRKVPGLTDTCYDKAVYSDDFYEDTESYTHRPISRQSYPFHCFHRHP
jgi:hypothetical protein